MKRLTATLTIAAALTAAAPAQALELATQDDGVFVEQRYSSPLIGCRVAKAIGATRVRFNAWPGREAAVSRAIANARTCGLAVQVTLTGRPKWLNSPSSQSPRVFARWAAERAREWTTVKRFSIWNEPNHGMFFRSPSPCKYAAIYRASYRYVKRVRPSAQVLMGETANFHGSARWIRRLAACRPGPTDGYAHHPYERVGKPVDYSISRIHRLRGDLYRMGIRSRSGRAVPVYATEFGYQVTVPKRGLLLRSAITKAKRAGIRQLLVYQLIAPDRAGWNSSLADHAGCFAAEYRILAPRYSC